MLGKVRERKMKKMLCKSLTFSKGVGHWSYANPQVYNCNISSLLSCWQKRGRFLPTNVFLLTDSYFNKAMLRFRC